MYQRYADYVKSYLEEHGGDSNRETFRSRFLHILRVCKWVERLTEGVEGIDMEALMTAAVFHDIGYGTGCLKEEHSLLGAEVFKSYAAENGLDSELTKKVYILIKNHDKKKEFDNTYPIELAYLRDADALDEEGAMEIAWDCMAAGVKGAKSFEDALIHIKEYSVRFAQTTLRTERGRKFAEEKVSFVENFIEELERDLERKEW